MFLKRLAANFCHRHLPYISCLPSPALTFLAVKNFSRLCVQIYSHQQNPPYSQITTAQAYIGPPVPHILRFPFPRCQLLLDRYARSVHLHPTSIRASSDKLSCQSFATQITNRVSTHSNHSTMFRSPSPITPPPSPPPALTPPPTPPPGPPPAPPPRPPRVPPRPVPRRRPRAAPSTSPRGPRSSPASAALSTPIFAATCPQPAPRAVGLRTSEAIKQKLRELHEVARLEDPIDDGWACRADGRCDFFPYMDLSQVQVLHSTPDYRLFKLTQREPAWRPDHVLLWGEAKGCVVSIWSEFVPKVNRHPGIEEARRAKNGLRFIVPNEKNVNLDLRTEMIEYVARVCFRPTDKILALGLTNLGAPHAKGNEVSWQIRPVRPPPRPVLSPLLISEKA